MTIRPDDADNGCRAAHKVDVLVRVPRWSLPVCPLATTIGSVAESLHAAM